MSTPDAIERPQSKRRRRRRNKIPCATPDVIYSLTADPSNNVTEHTRFKRVFFDSDGLVQSTVTLEPPAEDVCFLLLCALHFYPRRAELDTKARKEWEHLT